MSKRTSLYLTAPEDRGLRALAETSGATFNSLARVAIRMLLGLEVPTWAEELRQQEGEQHD